MNRPPATHGEPKDAGDERYSGAPSPDALLPKLDEGQLEVLHRVGREWDRVCGDREVWRRALPVDPDLGSYPDATEIRPTRFGRFVPVAGQHGKLPAIEATSEAETPSSLLGRAGHELRRVVVGRPLSATAIARERMRKLVALPVLSADALSSVAYGPEAMLAILVLAGAAGLSYSLPIAATIAFLMLAVGVSYRQTIRAYPHGGGSYIVASDNLGRVAGLVAAAGLMTDYILTVSVSIASGLEAITSAIPSLSSATVPIGAGVIVVLLAGNLRGVRQAGLLFAAPTYLFILAMFVLVAVGLLDASARNFQATPRPPITATEAVSALLILRAFSSGSTAMTGIEAISNAVPAFKPVEWRNARITLSWMIGLLIAMFGGVLVITRLAGIVPVASQTMLSQLAHLSFGDGPMYVYIQAATAAVLLLAANTSYNDFPRVLFLMARDRQAPRSFLRIGDRLTFRNGILLLSVTSAAIYIAFRGKTETLLPLYAVGVFLAFTLSQTGMIMHWRRHRDQPHWRRSLALNATGAVLSAIVFVIEAVTKFTEGAWVSLVLIAAIIVTALRTRRYYVRTGQQLALRAEDAAAPAQVPAKLAPRLPSSRPARGPGGAAPGSGAEGAEQPGQINALTIVAVEVMDRAGLQALAYAAALGQPAFALHISPTAEEADRFLGYWQAWGDHLPLEVIV